jgi:hypothetical protein
MEVDPEEWDSLKFKIAFDRINPMDRTKYEEKKRKMNAERDIDLKEGYNIELKNMKRDDEELRKQYFKFNFLNGLNLVGRRK